MSICKVPLSYLEGFYSCWLTYSCLVSIWRPRCVSHRRNLLTRFPCSERCDLDVLLYFIWCYAVAVQQETLCWQGTCFLARDSALKKPALLYCRLSCCRVLPVAAPENVSTRVPQTSTAASCPAQITLERDFTNTVVQPSGVNRSLILFWRTCTQNWKEGKPLC